MYDHEIKDQFVELRAQGLSLDAISSQLINPHECNAAVVLKTLEHEAAHRARQFATAEPG